MRIDRRRKLPVTTLLIALDNEETEKLRPQRASAGKTVAPNEATGMTPEDILDYFYKKITFIRVKKKGWKTEFVADRLRGVKLVIDLINAKTNRVAAKAGTKMTPRVIRNLEQKGLKEQLVTTEDLIGSYMAVDLINRKTGEIYIEAGGEITEETMEVLDNAKINEIVTLDIDHVNVGPYIRNTLAVDKNTNREEALIDIYRVMRPGEPPTLETAETLFGSLFFNSR